VVDGRLQAAPLPGAAARALESVVAARNKAQREAPSRNLFGPRETFWLAFVLSSVGLMLVAVRPAMGERAAAGRRAEASRAAIREHELYLKELRQAREALERGDPAAWEAVCRKYGLVRPGDLRIEAPAGGAAGAGR
jgi:hypothetical protein